MSRAPLIPVPMHMSRVMNYSHGDSPELLVQFIDPNSVPTIPSAVNAFHVCCDIRKEFSEYTEIHRNSTVSMRAKALDLLARARVKYEATCNMPYSLFSVWAYEHVQRDDADTTGAELFHELLSWCDPFEGPDAHDSMEKLIEVSDFLGCRYTSVMLVFGLYQSYRSSEESLKILRCLSTVLSLQTVAPLGAMPSLNLLSRTVYMAASCRALRNACGLVSADKFPSPIEVSLAVQCSIEQALAVINPPPALEEHNTPHPLHLPQHENQYHQFHGHYQDLIRQGSPGFGRRDGSSDSHQSRQSHQSRRSKFQLRLTNSAPSQPTPYGQTQSHSNLPHFQRHTGSSGTASSSISIATYSSLASEPSVTSTAAWGTAWAAEPSTSTTTAHPQGTSSSDLALDGNHAPSLPPWLSRQPPSTHAHRPPASPSLSSDGEEPSASPRPRPHSRLPRPPPSHPPPPPRQPPKRPAYSSSSDENSDDDGPPAKRRSAGKQPAKRRPPPRYAADPFAPPEQQSAGPPPAVHYTEAVELVTEENILQEQFLDFVSSYHANVSASGMRFLVYLFDQHRNLVRRREELREREAHDREQRRRWTQLHRPVGGDALRYDHSHDGAESSTQLEALGHDEHAAAQVPVPPDEGYTVGQPSPAQLSLYLPLSGFPPPHTHQQQTPRFGDAQQEDQHPSSTARSPRLANASFRVHPFQRQQHHRALVPSAMAAAVPPPPYTLSSATPLPGPRPSFGAPPVLAAPQPRPLPVRFGEQDIGSLGSLGSPRNGAREEAHYIKAEDSDNDTNGADAPPVPSRAPGRLYAPRSGSGARSFDTFSLGRHGPMAPLAPTLSPDDGDTKPRRSPGRLGVRHRGGGAGDGADDDTDSKEDDKENGADG